MRLKLLHTFMCEKQFWEYLCLKTSQPNKHWNKKKSHSKSSNAKNLPWSKDLIHGKISLTYNLWF